MFFNEEEMKVAEDLAWKMLDGWNHAYFQNLEDYAHFYYKDHLILDPWMNEKCQDLPWPDHESKESAVDPIAYYGQETIENYMVSLFMHRPEWAPQITEKIKPNLDSQGRLKRVTTSMPVEVYIAMSEGQAREEHGFECIGWALPESSRIYFDMVDLPEDLVHVVKNGWEKEIVFEKKNAKKVFKLLYPDKSKFDYEQEINRVYGKCVRLLGFGD